jgi:hypothetical protein
MERIRLAQNKVGGPFVDRNKFSGSIKDEEFLGQRGVCWHLKDLSHKAF